MKAVVFIVGVIVLIALTTVFKVVQYRSDFSPFTSWIVAGISVGVVVSTLWVRLTRPHPGFGAARFVAGLTFMVTASFFGLSFINWALDLKAAATAVPTWPSVQATITGQGIYESPPTKLRSPGGRFAPIWDYTYVVDGRTYQSHSRSTPGAFILVFKPTQELARQELDRRPVGAQVTAFYDPRSPDKSVLDKKDYDSGETYLQIAVGAFVFICGVGGAIALARLRRTRSSSSEPSTESGFG